VDRSNQADVAPAIDVFGGDAATSQATFAELVPRPWGVFSRLCGGHEWQGEIDDEKSPYIQVVKSGGSRTPAGNGIPPHKSLTNRNREAYLRAQLNSLNSRSTDKHHVRPNNGPKYKTVFLESLLNIIRIICLNNNNTDSHT